MAWSILLLVLLHAATDKKAKLIMSEYYHIGMIKHNEQWRIFGDNGSRNKWGISFKDVSPNEIPYEIPDNRHDLLSIDASNVEQFITSFDSEIKSEEIVSDPATYFVTFVINFDEKVFVDGGHEEAIHFSLAHYVPSDWKFVIDEPIFYVPQQTSYLWLKSRLQESGITYISSHAIIGAIKYKGNWKLYALHYENWIMDLQVYMIKSNPSWSSNKIYGDFRKDFPILYEGNVSKYIETLKDFEISTEDFSNLQFALSEDERLQIEGSLTLLEGTDETMKNNHLAFINPRIKPSLNFIIDFDNKIYVKKGKQKVAASTTDLCVPPNWTCYYDIPENYIPSDLL